MEDIEIIQTLTAIQDVNNLSKYNVYQIEMRKQISTNKILLLHLKKANIHTQITQKEVYTLARESEFDLCISSIMELSPKSRYINLYGMKEEHEVISQYIENFNSILIEGMKSQQLTTGTEIFLLDTDSQSNRWKWDIYQIKPHTIAMMMAIRYGLKQRGSALLQAFNAVID